MFSQESVSLREDTYELCYNTACLLIGREEYEEALEKLQRAEGLLVQFVRVSFT